MVAAFPLSLVAVAVASSLAAQLKCVDMSSLPSLDCGGSCSPFRASVGGPQGADALAVLATAGVNCARLRIWNAPARNAEYANLTGVLGMATRATRAGLQVYLDFHYSDTWADPSHQAKPAAWAQLAPDALVAAVAAWTTEVVTALVAQGTPPALIEIGNEVDPGMLWNDAADACNTGGRVTGACASNWPMFGRLVAAGLAAARAAAPSALLLMHSYQGSRLNRPDGVLTISEFFGNLTAHGAGGFDVIGEGGSAPLRCAAGVSPHAG